MEIPYSEEVTEKPTKNSDGNFDFALVDLKLARNYTQGSKIVPVRLITPVGQSAQEFKLTDGTDLLAINSDGSINVSTSTFSYKNLMSSSSSVLPTQLRSTALGVAGTVPAGKIWVIVSCGLAGGGELTIRDNAGANDLQVLQIQPAGTGTSALIYAMATAGEKIYFNKADCYICYYEISA
jgi:hypothetical protein